MLWLGADRDRAAASSQVGSLIAYLSYLVQILMSVVMATFTVSMVPRAAVSADRIQEVLDTELVGRAAGRPGPRRARATASSSCATSGSTTPAPSTPVLERHLLHHHAPGTPPPSSAAPAPARRRWSTSCRGCSTPPPARCSSTASTCATSTPTCCGTRIGLVPAAAVPVLRHRGQQPPVRQARRHRGRDVGGARGRPGRRLRAGHARRARGAHRAGRHQRVRRPAPAPVDRPGARPQARDLRVRRLVLGARPGHRRPAARRPRAVHRATPPS